MYFFVRCVSSDTLQREDQDMGVTVVLVTEGLRVNVGLVTGIHVYLV